MKIISVAIKDLMLTLKDKKAVALIILMPIVLIFVLGMSLSSMFANDGAKVNKFDLAVVDEDGGEYAIHFKDFLKSDEIEKMVTLRETDLSDGMKIVQNGKVPAMIVIPYGYSSSVKDGKEAKVEIYKDPGSPLKGEIVESLVKSYTGVGSAVQNAIDAAVAVFSDYGLNGSIIASQIIDSAGGSENSRYREQSLNGQKGLSAMQYYSAAMLVMYILFVGMLGTLSIIQERENKTLLRLMSTAVSKFEILSGKFLGLFMIGVFDVAVLILFTRFAFRVDWGNSVPGILVLSAAMIFAASGFAMFLAAIYKTSKSADAISTVLVMVMSFAGGSMLPLFSMPDIMQMLSKITLNNWALRGYLSLMQNGGIGSITVPSIVLCVIGTIFLTAGIFRLKLE